MSIEKAKAHLEKFGLAERIQEFPVSSATVALAAEALGTEEARIAKSLSFDLGDEVILIIAAGNARIDNHKFKEKFKKKAKMLPFPEVEAKIGHAVGGVCPFGINSGVSVYLDSSLKPYPTVFPACGSSNSAVELTLEELEKASGFKEWVDVCKLPESNA